MAIKVAFSAGKDTATVQGLFQWDYGQTLEIECADIGFEIVEVHFACPDMTMAIPRPCTFTGGVGTVPIPDQCLEQENPITAWICRIDDTQGHTIKTVTLPVTKRTKPIRTHEVPAELIDKYSELIVEVTETVDSLKNGSITAAKATHAESANKANTATHAENAAHATTASSADNATYSNAAGAIVMKRVTSCEIVKGEGTIEGNVIKNNTPYFLVFEPNTISINDYNSYISSGVLVARKEDSGGTLIENFCGCALDTTRGIWFDYVPEATNTTVTITNTATSTGLYADTSVNGTLYIYTFGDITQ